MTIILIGALLPNIFPYICLFILIIFIYNKFFSKLINNRYCWISFNTKLSTDKIIPTKTVPDDVDHVLLKFKRLPKDVQLKTTEDFLNSTTKYRYPKSFTNDDVPIQVIENVIKTAGTCPSGVHTEPWTFAVIKNAILKRKIRCLIEQEEYKQWERSLKKTPFNFTKSYLELAPCLIIIFKQIYGLNEVGERKTHYQNQVTVAMATGVLIAALQNVGLTTIPCSPLNTGPAIRQILKRPINEKALFLLPVGYADETLPMTRRKSLTEIMKLFS